jgi:hypothetical protein
MGLIKYPLAKIALITNTEVAAQVGLQHGLELTIDTPPE